jgi:hypothetical protein
MKVKVFRKVGFFKHDYEIVYCERVRYLVEEKIFTGYVDDSSTQALVCISNATGYVVLNMDKGDL